MVFLLSHEVQPPPETMPKNKFLKHLLSDWSLTYIKEISDANNPYVLEWTMQIQEAVFGQFREIPLGLSLEGRFIDCANVALWYRRLIPFEYPLLFYPLTYVVDISINEQTTYDDIATKFEGEI